MSMRPALQATSRAISSALRPSPVAGPSRIPLTAHVTRHFSASPTSREPTTEICVRTSAPLPSILHTLAVLRAVEAHYGQVVLLDVPRDPDSLQAGKSMFMTLLHPVELGKQALHEIPAPVSSLGDKERFGGPSLADVQAVLSSSSSPSSSSSLARHTAKAGNRKGKGQQEFISFQVEKRKNAGKRRYTRDMSAKRMTDEMMQEDEEIVKALEGFGPGFFGGFEGVAAKHRALLEERRRSRAARPRRPDAADAGIIDGTEPESDTQAREAEQEVARG